jgi:hypothetical protein
LSIIDPGSNDAVIGLFRNYAIKVSSAVTVKPLAVIAPGPELLETAAGKLIAEFPLQQPYVTFPAPKIPRRHASTLSAGGRRRLQT